MKIEGTQYAISEVTLVRPSRGVWTADVVTDQPHDLLGGECVLRLTGELDETRLVGTILETSPGALRVVGAAGLRRAPKPRWFRGLSMRLACSEVCSSVGERLDASSDTLSTRLASYMLPGHVPAGQSLSELLRGTGLTWRSLDSGAVWVGKVAAKPFGVTYDVIDRTPYGITVATESVIVQPGDVIDGRTVACARGVLTSSSTRWVIEWA